MTTEAVDHPAHYGGTENPYEAIKVIDAWGLGFNSNPFSRIIFGLLAILLIVSGLYLARQAVKSSNYLFGVFVLLGFVPFLIGFLLLLWILSILPLWFRL